MNFYDVIKQWVGTVTHTNNKTPFGCYAAAAALIDLSVDNPIQSNMNIFKNFNQVTVQFIYKDNIVSEIWF